MGLNPLGDIERLMRARLIAGLQMAALLQSRLTAQNSSASGSHRFVLEYLVERFKQTAKGNPEFLPKPRSWIDYVRLVRSCVDRLIIGKVQSCPSKYDFSWQRFARVEPSIAPITSSQTEYLEHATCSSCLWMKNSTGSATITYLPICCARLVQTIGSLL
jgi:hypothetical protein